MNEHSVYNFSKWGQFIIICSYIFYCTFTSYLSDSLFILWSAFYINFILINFQYKKESASTPKFLWIFHCRVMELRRNTLLTMFETAAANSLDRQFSNKCYNFMIRKKLAINSRFYAWLHFLMSIISHLLYIYEHEHDRPVAWHKINKISHLIERIENRHRQWCDFNCA